MFFLLFLIPSSSARYCVDNINGTCHADNLFGWCFHNKSSGVFNCDDSGWCANRPSIQGKAKSTGCFIVPPSNETICCCNDLDGCNIAFITMPPVDKKHTYKCHFSHEEPKKEPKVYRACDDPWCYSLMTAEVDGGLTTVWKGCQSRTLIKYHMYKAEDELYMNNTRWKESKHLIGMPRCEDIAYDGIDNNGTISRCFEYEWEDDNGVEHRGRLCCCKGGDKCNGDFGWSSPVITLEEVEENARRRIEDSNKIISSISSSSFSTFASLIPFLIRFN